MSQSASKKHTVVEGETLWKISQYKHYNVTFSKIKDANSELGKKTPPWSIGIGEIINIPEPSTSKVKVPTSSVAECTNSTSNQKCYIHYSSIIDEFTEVVDSEIEKSQKITESIKAKYTKNKWNLDDLKNDRRFNSHKERLELYPTYKENFNTLTQEGCKKKYGDDLLLLAAVALNEAGGFGEQAQKAVCYAFLNRTENIVLYPANKHISHFSTRNFVEGIIREEVRSKVEIKTWAPQIISCIKSAMYRLDQGEKCGSSYPLKTGAVDMVNGATHWVSPKGLSSEGYKKIENDNGKLVCRKGVPREGFANCFPEWTDPKKEKKISEVDVQGIKKENFMFFKGVRYKVPTDMRD